MCQTAIKAVIFLCSQRGKSQYTGIKQIAVAIESSEHTVGKILQALVKNEIINSLKGPSGGFFISEDQESLPILKIVDAIDGRSAFTECGLGLSKCSARHPCPIHFQYESVRAGLERVFREKKVGDLCHSVSIGEAYLAG